MTGVDSEKVELVVVGAGLYGLTAAVTYHKLHPEANILVLEASPSIGGPWAPERIFPGLKTNNLLGTYENPDFPMDGTKYDVKKTEHVSADKVSQYWRDFAEDGGVTGFIRLNTKVEVAEKIGGGWKLHCQPTGPNHSSNAYTLLTRRLLISTGLTNRPSIPSYLRSPTFTPPILHSSTFPTHFNEVSRPNTHTLVIGAGKSAWDIAYACATHPTWTSTVTMLIRPSGKGPIWMSPPFVTPLKQKLEGLVFTRFIGFFSPCPWAGNSGFEGVVRRFLHGTWIGRKIVAGFWSVLGKDVVELNGYEKHEETKKLRPWRDAFEVGNALSILNYDRDWFELVRNGRIKVVIGEVERFGEGKEVYLIGGQKLEVDAVVCATGWETGAAMKFLPEGIEKDLGIPVEGGKLTEDEKELVKKAEVEIYSKYPFLKERDSSQLYHPDPTHRLSVKDTLNEKTQNPYRLFRFLVPPSDLEERSIGFAGALLSLGNATCAYLQALWLAAYFDGTLSLPSSKSASEVKYEAYLETQYCAIRHAMGYGDKFPDLVFDSLPYFDALLKDLGLVGKRKDGFRKEYFAHYTPEDYRGLVEEWKRCREGKEWD
ncbi:flavin-binding monooxygenase-like protein-like protein [Delitschia confertaspora ATCC 74209]|uniref:Flavin-binding monooxygenase-like protein-like protein n=1 Tax=Delitschia confertaspora ATCC 74209 TaxID=1513339 RepID=A0A9P4MSJ8_9PLEO|nr:flavin-binding monooxygenase-like protein-like protein [Delitschia confertaspora ATCC 74209]